VDHNYDQTTRDLTEVIDARGKSKTRTYEQNTGLLLTENRPDGSKTTITRDSQGRPSQTKIEGTAPGLDEVTVTTYDNLGRLTVSRVRMASTTADDPSDLVTTKTYDRDGNLLTVTDTVRPCTTYSYDQNGNQTATRVALSRPAGAVCAFGTAGITWSETTRAFDTRNLKSSETLVAADYPGNIITAWQFDAAGRTTKVTDPRGNFVDYTYDANNRKLTETRTVSLGGIARSSQNRVTPKHVAPVTKRLVASEHGGVRLRHTYGTRPGRAAWPGSAGDAGRTPSATCRGSSSTTRRVCNVQWASFRVGAQMLSRAHRRNNQSPLPSSKS
jgi:YD repeat-containing protein